MDTQFQMYQSVLRAVHCHQRSTATFRISRLALLALLGFSMVAIRDAEVWARARDLVAIPGLMDTPLQRIDSRMEDFPLQRNESRMREFPLQQNESRMGDFPLQRNESRMMDSPLQLIGGPFGGGPFGPHRFATLPTLQPLRATEGAASSEPRPAAKPKFSSLRCGRFEAIEIPPAANLSAEENKPCR